MTDQSISLDKPLPDPDGPSRVYIEHCQRHELWLQRCLSCGAIQFGVRTVCADCLSREIEGFKSSGRGKVHTFSVVRRAPTEAWRADCPYVIAIVELDEGPRMMAQVKRCDPDQVKCEMDVKVFFEDVAVGISLPQFEPA